MLTSELLSQLLEANQYFSDSKFGSIVEKASEAWREADYAACESLLSKLPTTEVLLKSLVKQLKGKSVYSNLERLQESGVPDWKALKVISSLITHAAIEIEKGNKEYRKLVPLLLEKLNNACYGLLK